jgi:hypothetical protein
MAPAKLMLEIDKNTRNRFKAKVALEGATIKDVLTKMIQEYLEPRAAERRQKRGKE